MPKRDNSKAVQITVIESSFYLICILYNCCKRLYFSHDNFFIFFLTFANLWWFGGWSLGVEILNSVFGVRGFQLIYGDWECGEGPSRFVLGLELLIQTKQNNLGKKTARCKRGVKNSFT